MRISNFFFLFVSFGLLIFSCDQDWYVKKIKKHDLNGFVLKQINKNKVFKIYNAKKDFGPPRNEVTCAIIEKKGVFFMINPKYGYSIFEDTVILLRQTYTMDPNPEGNWVLIKREIINGYHVTSFLYDTIPIFKLNLKKLDVGYAYLFKKDQFHKLKSLRHYSSFHELSSEGFYYFSSPGIFYEKFISISIIK